MNSGSKCFLLVTKRGGWAEKWHLFSNWLVALIAVFYCHYIVVRICSGLRRWPWDTAGFQVFCQRRRKGPDSLDGTCCYSYFALTTCLRYPALQEEWGDGCGADWNVTVTSRAGWSRYVRCSYCWTMEKSPHWEQLWVVLVLCWLTFDWSFMVIPRCQHPEVA